MAHGRWVATTPKAGIFRPRSAKAASLGVGRTVNMMSNGPKWISAHKQFKWRPYTCRLPQQKELEEEVPLYRESLPCVPYRVRRAFAESTAALTPPAPTSPERSMARSPSQT